MRWLESIIDSMGMNLRKFKDSGGSERQKNWCAPAHGIAKS